MPFTHSQKQRLLDIWSEEEMPDDIAQRQLARLESDTPPLSDALASRIGQIQTVIGMAQFWRLFDTLYEAGSVEQLPPELRQIIEDGEATLRARCHSPSSKSP